MTCLSLFPLYFFLFFFFFFFFFLFFFFFFFFFLFFLSRIPNFLQVPLISGVLLSHRIRTSIQSHLPRTEVPATPANPSRFLLFRLRFPFRRYAVLALSVLEDRIPE